MILNIGGNIIDTKGIYYISEVNLSDHSFDIVFFNKIILNIRTKHIISFFIENPILENETEEAHFDRVNELAVDNLKRVKSDLVDLWKENQYIVREILL